MEKSLESQSISSKISNFLLNGDQKTSYKIGIFEGILWSIKQKKFEKLTQNYLISLENLAYFFFRFNYYLYKKCNLKLNIVKENQAKICSIIDEIIENNNNSFKKIPEIPEDSLKEIIKLMLRHVLFLLRKDCYIYEFYDFDKNIIRLTEYINDEQEFKNFLDKQSLKTSNIYAISISDEVYGFLESNSDILEFALTTKLSKFLAKINDIPDISSNIELATNVK